MTSTFKNFRISANYTGSKAAPWSGDNWNHHNITVTNTENGKRTRFDFWASIARPDLSTDYDVINAFRCFVDDAISGGMDFSEFCGEFGYDEDSRKAYKTWRDCQRSAAKLERIYTGDVYELINSMDDYA